MWNPRTVRNFFFIISLAQFSIVILVRNHNVDPSFFNRNGIPENLLPVKILE